jgi:acetyltransferase-like isoleucine patch superfamily enzyme
MRFDHSDTQTLGGTASADTAGDAVGGEPSWSHRIYDRAREAAGSMAAPLWLWSCTHVGARPRTLGRPRILNRGQIEIRDHVVIDSRFSRTELVTAPGGRIVIGSGTLIEHGVMLVANRLVELGDRVRLGAYCIVSDSDSPDLTSGATSEDAKPIWIGDEVVIGARATVLPGATIGARSQVLPGSIVSGELPPGVIAGGNPARPLRKLRLAGAQPSAPDAKVPGASPLGPPVDAALGAQQ